MNAAQAPAGFWRRYAAWSLDWLLLSAPLALLLAPRLAQLRAQHAAIDALLQDWVFEHMVAADGGFPSPLAMALDLLRDRALADRLQAQLLELQLGAGVIALVVLGAGALWFIGFEASPWRATPGKRLARIRVDGVDGARLPFARVALRHASGALSWLALNLGHAIAGWRKDRRALHDLIAGAQLHALGPMPRWARWFLLVQGALALAGFVGLLCWLGWLLWQFATL